jgi:hypothetical protein
LWRVVPQVLYQRLAYYNLKWYAGSPHCAAPVLGIPGMAPHVLREVAAMRRLRRLGVLRLHKVLATRSRVCLVIELAPCGDLQSALATANRKGGFPERALPGPRRLRRLAWHMGLTRTAATTACDADGWARHISPRDADGHDTHTTTMAADSMA